MSYAKVIKSGKPKPASRKVTKPLIGTKKDVLGSSLKTIGRKKWLFLSRLAPDVKLEDLNFYLSEVGFRELSVLKLRLDIRFTSHLKLDYVRMTLS